MIWKIACLLKDALQLYCIHHPLVRELPFLTACHPGTTEIPIQIKVLEVAHSQIRTKSVATYLLMQKELNRKLIDANVFQLMSWLIEKTFVPINFITMVSKVYEDYPILSLVYKFKNKTKILLFMKQ